MKLRNIRGIGRLTTRVSRITVGLVLLLAVIVGQSWGSAAVFAQANSTCSFWRGAGPNTYFYPGALKLVVSLYANLHDDTQAYCGGVYAFAEDTNNHCRDMKLGVQDTTPSQNWGPGAYT